MQILIDILIQTLRTLWAHKLRSFLTMFGIAWGVGSLLLLIGLGEGFRTGNRKQLDQIGENVMFSFPGRVPPAPGSTNGMRPYYITYRDYLDVKREAPTVKQVAPVLARNDIRAVSESQNSNGQVVGTLPAFGHLRYLPVKQGRWLNDEDDLQKRQVAVIGFEMRKNLFPDLTQNVLGESILLNGVQFTVIGVLQNVGKDENNPGNARIYIPHSVMHQYFPAKGQSLPQDYVNNLIYQPVTREQHIEARDEVRRILARNHQFDYRLTDAFEDWDTVRSAELVGKIFTAMNLFLGSVGIITLALGAIGRKALRGCSMGPGNRGGPPAADGQMGLVRGVPLADVPTDIERHIGLLEFGECGAEFACCVDHHFRGGQKAQFISHCAKVGLDLACLGLPRLA